MLKKLLEKKLFIVPFLGFAISLGFVFCFIYKNSNLFVDNYIKSNSGILTASANGLPSEEKANLGLPVRLKIPKINVDAVVEYVGLTPDGAMDTPNGPRDIAWYKLGPKPGDVGSAVMDGHSGWNNGIPAVFDNLYKLKKGDKIYVENDMGVTTTFIVREIGKYDPNADASDVFISNDGKSHLNLITCTGFWNKIWKSHSERLVVFTDKE